MTNLIPQGWYGVICTGLLVGSIVFIIILCILAIQDARERQIKKHIKYAVLEFWDKSTPAMAFLVETTYMKAKSLTKLQIEEQWKMVKFQHENSQIITTRPSTVSDMEDKLHNLGDKLQGKTIMGVKITDKDNRDVKGRFVKKEWK